ncbi:deoxyribonuclease IV [Paenibacillus sp. CC-CFT747]|nr:deoxyribonuclease IV [Paenibacillus sp. CC-CFT747]
MYVGSHISIRHGYSGAARTALSLEANAFQYFPKNPRSLTVKQVDTQDAAACAELSRSNGLVSISHSPYPSNLAIAEPGLAEAVAASLRNDLDITNACGSIGVVVHFGKSKQKDPLQGYKDIIGSLNRILEGWEGESLILLENQAGEGTGMGMTLRELTQIRSLTERPDKIGFCLDTCHAFAAGIWTGDNWEAMAEEGHETGYWEHLKAVHLNDSVYPSGSRRDRHANIGQGQIGVENLVRLITSPEMNGIPLILETGSGPDGTHREEIALVKELASRTGKL